MSTTNLTAAAIAIAVENPLETPTAASPPESSTQLSGGLGPETVCHPEVRRYIEYTLRSFGMGKQELEDGVAEVQTRMLAYLKSRPRPGDLKGWRHLAILTTRNWRMNEKAKAKTRSEVEVELCEFPDEEGDLPVHEHRWEPLDATRMIRVLQQMFDEGRMPPQGDEILDCLHADMKYPEIGAELGIDAETARGRWREMRKRFSVRLAMLGMTVTALLLLIVGSGFEAAQHFLDIDHAQLPKAHRRSPTASRAVVGQHRARGRG
jgi:DNA-directed RNA polymerase specialized sigma24 family protein